MSSQWIHRAIIFVEWNRLTPANASAAAWDPDTGGGETFGNLRLSADGQEPPSHSMCNTALTESMRLQVLDAISHAPWMTVYWTSEGWVVESALIDMGLQLIEIETEAPIAIVEGDLMWREKVAEFVTRVKDKVLAALRTMGERLGIGG